MKSTIFLADCQMKSRLCQVEFRAGARELRSESVVPDISSEKF